MAKIGVTGGIGSGKSTVCRMFGMLGVPVYDSDARAKDLMTSDAVLVGEIKDTFGENSYSQGVLNREYLAARVFSDKKNLTRLNSLVHPAVMRDFHRWSESESGSSPGYVILESAIIIEAGLKGDLDFVITVSAPEDIRIARTMERDKSCRTKVEARILNQISDAEREKHADFVIYNDDMQMVWTQVLELDRRFRK